MQAAKNIIPGQQDKYFHGGKYDLCTLSMTLNLLLSSDLSPDWISYLYETVNSAMIMYL